MPTTLSSGSHENTYELVEVSNALMQGSQHTACEKCRSKKVTGALKAILRSSVAECALYIKSLDAAVRERVVIDVKPHQAPASTRAVETENV